MTRVCPAEPSATPPQPSDAPTGAPTGAPTDAPAGVVRFRDAHVARGGAGRLVALPEAAHTAAKAAAALGCEIVANANSLVFDTEDGPVLVLTSGAHRVDVVATAARIGVPALRRATPDAVRAATGQVIGGVSPLGHPAPVPTWVDVALSDHPVVWAAAGHPSWVFSTTYDELLALTGGTPVGVEAG